MRTRQELEADMKALKRENNKLKMVGPQWAIDLCRTIAMELPGKTDPIEAVKEASMQVKVLQRAYLELDHKVQEQKSAFVPGSPIVH